MCISSLHLIKDNGIFFFSPDSSDPSLPRSGSLFQHWHSHREPSQTPRQICKERAGNKSQLFLRWYVWWMIYPQMEKIKCKTVQNLLTFFFVCLKCIPLHSKTCSRVQIFCTLLLQHSGSMGWKFLLQVIASGSTVFKEFFEWHLKCIVSKGS